MEVEEFKKLGLNKTLKSVKRKGFEKPTKIQEKIIPRIFHSNKDLIGQAHTGTGKTAAFALPILEILEEEKSKKINEERTSVLFKKQKIKKYNKKNIKVIILTPTRELALQVSEEINSLSINEKIKTIPIYGGQNIREQYFKLERGIDIVVGTPGRILDHLGRGSIILDDLSFFILDEADEMLDMGFIPDIEKILKMTNKNKRTLLFSATMPKKILNLVKNYMKEYELIKVENKQLTTDLTEQIYFEVSEKNKFESLCKIIDNEEDFYAIVFCRTKNNTETIFKKLNYRGYRAEMLNGDIVQKKRERILNRFKFKKTNILVATDVAARGLDITNLTHVINYSLPQDPEGYVHRIGRTGRAGVKGTAITFITPGEYKILLKIQSITKSKIEKKDINFLKQAKKESFVDKEGQTRLFVALGKKNKMTQKKLAEFIKERAEIDRIEYDDIKIFENFSFINVTLKDAEKILSFFKKNTYGTGSPIVQKAKK